MYYIDYFEKTLTNFNDVDYHPPEYIDQLRTIISRHMHSDDSGLKEKYSWLRSKYNKMVQEIKEHRSSDGFHEEDWDLYEFYRNLDYL